MFQSCLIDLREEDPEAAEINTHEICGLNTGLNSLKYLITVHRCVPKECTDEKERKNLPSECFVDKT